MRRTTATGLGLALIAIAIAPARAADHIDGTQVVSPDASADITDVYAWMNEDATKVNLVVNVNHDATDASRFNTAVQYVIHVGAHTAFAPFAAGTEKVVLCTFAPNGRGQCWLGGAAGGVPDAYVADIDSVTGDEAGVANAAGTMRVFAGLRNDPFFFNLAGFQAVAATVAAVGGTLPPGNAFGCPLLDPATSTALARQLARGDADAAPTDTFAGLNVLSIVVQLDKALVSDATNPILSVWASTRVEE